MSLFPGKSDHSPLHEDKVTSSSLPSLCVQCRGKINTQGNVSFFLFPNRRGAGGGGESPTLPFPVFFVEKLEHLAVAVDMSLALAPKKNWRDFLFLLLAIKVFMHLFFSPPFSKHLSRKSRSKRRPTTTTTINMSTDV